MGFDMRSPGRDSEDPHSPFLAADPEPIEDPRPKPPLKRSETASSYRTGKMLAHWESEGHDSPILESKRLLVGVVSALILIVAYSIYTDSPFMAITFILIGMTGYLLLNQPAEPTEYMVTEKGIRVGHEFYGYESMLSFWIIEGHPQFPKHLIIDISGILTPRVHIPLEGNDSDVMRRVLLKYVPEEEHEPTIVDIIERILHI